MEVSKDIIKGKIVTSEINEANMNKIKRDLHFIDLMTQVAKEKSCRLIVSGGYAVDGSLGQLTRPHNDIDIQIYGESSQAQEVTRQLLESVKKKEAEFAQVELEDKGRQEYYHAFFAEGNGLGSDIYYVQVTEDPFGNKKHVVKKDGSQTKTQHYHTILVTLEGTTFEANDPTSELVDRRYKREIRGDQPKPQHDQDMTNLKLITDEKAVEAKLATMRKKF